MTVHPWERAPSLAGTLGLMMGATAIIITSLSLEQLLLRTIFITLGSIALFFLTLLFLVIFFLGVRDYVDQYHRYNRYILFKWAKY